MDIAGLVNGINQATQIVGAVNGAVNIMAPMLQTVDQQVSQVAGTINGAIGYRPDMYAAPPGYYPPQQGIPATMPMPTTASSSNSSIMGSVGNALAGGGIGALMGTKLYASMSTPPMPTTEGLASKISPNMKNIGMTGLKAGGIGAAAGAVFSGIENMTKVSRNEITGAEATGNIAADATVGFFSGMGGLAGGTLGAKLMTSFGARSLPVAIGAGVVGLVGATVVDQLFKQTGIRDSISSGIRSAIGS